MNHLKIPILISVLSLIIACGQTADDIKIKSNGVQEGAYHSKALSATHLTSNYPMITNHSLQQPISFKLSLNGQDNEAVFGVDHELVIPEGISEYYAPNLQFGVPFPAPRGVIPALKHAANVYFRVDLRPVLNAFQEQGYFTTPTNDTIYSGNFQGLYIAGSTEPLEWIWESPNPPENLRFQDLDQDSIYELRVHFQPPDQEQSERSWELSADISAFPQFSSPQAPLMEALTNMAMEEALLNIRDDEAFSAGKEWQGVWTRDISYATQLSLAYLFPENAKTSLRAKLTAAGRIIQDTGTGGSWPISSDRHIWTLAAWEIFLATGDRDWLDEIRGPVFQALKEDLVWNRDPISGMLLGETSFEDWREQTYPPWMSPADIHSSHALSTNIIFKRALEIGLALTEDDRNFTQSWPQLITRLDQSIMGHFWSERLNAPASYIISTPAWLPASHRDILGESLGILFCNSFSPMASQLVASYPRTRFGSPLISHQLPHSPPYHNKAIWPFVETYALLAAKLAGVQELYLHSFNGLIRAASLFLTHRENYHYSTGRPDQTQINSDRQLWSVAGWLGAIYKGLFGISINYDFSGQGFELQLNPNNPFQWDEFSLTNLKLHNTPITISLNGTGSIVKTMTVNGSDHPPNKPLQLLGEALDIIIELEAHLSESTPVIMANNVLPHIPDVRRALDTLMWSGETQEVILELNGRPLDTLSQHQILIPDTLAGFFSLRSLDSTGALSLPSQVHYLGPSASLVLNSQRPYYIELGQENAFVKMSFALPEDGNYLIRFIYSNGSGPINTGSSCGLAKLKINDWWLEQMVSFPHTATWENWQYSSWAKAEFQAGQNTITLDQESLPVSNMDGTQNLFRVQSAEIVPISE
ncbi:hypothetical protein HQ531_08115 [bacterium]|nr:hypothetical protein [bacterium]